MATNNQIAKGAIISYFSIFLNIAITLAYTPWMIHKIGVSDYGLYSLVGAFLSYFLLDFGLTNTITRFIAKYRAEGAEEKVANMLGLTARIFFIFDIVIFVVLTVLYFFLSNIFGGLTPEEIERLKVLYCISGVFSVLSFVFKPVSAAMMSYEFFVENKILDLIIRVGTVVLIIIVLLSNGNVYHVVFVTGFVGFVVAVVRYVVFVKKSKIRINWRYFDKSELLELCFYSVWVLLIQISQMFRLNLIPTVLGVFSNTTEISVFSVGRSLEGFVYTISAALNGLFLPMVSRMVQSHNRANIMDLMIRVGRIQLFIITLIFTGFCIFGDSFLQLWVGEVFHDSYYVFVLLVFVNIISLTLQIGMDLVYAENKIKPTAILVFVSSLIGIILSIIVAPKYGAVGCAACTGFALVLTQILYVIYFNNKMGLDMKKFFSKCHLKILPILTIYALLAYFLRKLIVVDNWFMLILLIGGYTVGYCMISYFFLLNSYEKDLILGFIKIRKK